MATPPTSSATAKSGMTRPITVFSICRVNPGAPHQRPGHLTLSGAESGSARLPVGDGREMRGTGCGGGLGKLIRRGKGLEVCCVAHMRTT